MPFYKSKYFILFCIFGLISVAYMFGSNAVTLEKAKNLFESMFYLYTQQKIDYNSFKGAENVYYIDIKNAENSNKIIIIPLIIYLIGIWFYLYK